MTPIKILLAAAMFCGSAAYAQQLELIGQRTIYVTAPDDDDSASFKHSGGRNSKIPVLMSHFTSTPMKYDTCYYSIFQISNTIPEWQITRQFDGNNRETQYAESQWSVITNSYMPSSRIRYSYGSNQLIDSAKYENYEQSSSTYKLYKTYSYAYNAANKIVELKIQEWNNSGMTWKIVGIDSTWYDTLGVDSAMGGNGFIDHDTVKYYNTLHRFVYNTSAQLIRDSFYVNATSDNVHEYTYNSNGQPLSRMHLTKVLGNWRPVGKRLYFYDANDNATSVHDSVWVVADNAYKATGKRLYTYNSYHQITNEESQAFINNAWTTNTIKKYYYGALITNVKTVANSNVSMKVYPVPAIANTTLELSFKQPQEFGVAIYSIDGRLVKQWHEAAVKNYTKAITVLDLPAGTYSVQVATKEGVQAQQFSVIK